MVQNRRVFIVFTLALLLPSLAGCGTAALGASTDTLTASGTISATQINLATEIGGKVMTISVKKGDRVKAGQVLFQLDDSLLRAQRDQAAAALQAAQAALRTAEANANKVREGARPQEIAQAEASVAVADAHLKRLTNGATPEEIATAQQAVAVAQANLDRVRSGATPDQLTAADAAVQQAQVAVQQAQTQYDRIAWKGGASASPQAVALQQATIAYNQAKATYDNLVKGPTAAEIKVYQQQVAQAQAALDQVRAGANAEDVAAAQASLQAAQAALDLLKAGARPEDIAAAQAQVDAAQAQVTQAEANVKALDIQLGKTEVKAPNDGVVLSVPLHVGEMAPAGTTILQIGVLDQVTLTVYVPEDQYGHVHLGQPANVSVDSFPGKTFQGTVSYISDQTEFTPKNVQTKESRSTTVYAIEITLDNLTQDLKPGMPADVVFAQS